MHLTPLALPGAPMLLADPAGQRIASSVFGPRPQSAWGADLFDFNEAVRAPALLNSWVDFNPVYASSGYWKDSSGIVHLRGVISSGTGMNTIAFNLPAGYRPALREIFGTSSNSAFGSVEIQPTGDVIPAIGSTVWFSLCGISFRAA